MSRKKYSLIGYAYGDAARVSGSAEAPRVLRELNIVERLEALNVEIIDLGDAGLDAQIIDWGFIEQNAGEAEKLSNKLTETYYACEALSKKTTAALESGTTPLIVGGDHSLSIGSVAAVSNYYSKTNQDIGLIWVDTHTDINTPQTSPSKNIYGMSVAYLAGMIPGVLSSLQTKAPAVKIENVAYLGVRDLDPGEKIVIRDRNILALTMKEIDIIGMAAATKRAIDHVSKNTAGYVVSFDLDVCDPQLVPGTGVPVRGGLTFREAHLLLELVAEDNRMLSFELVELNPKLDKDFATAELAVSLIESALGKTII